MIEKIIKIKNVGRFKDYLFQSSNNWNGIFEKINIIYASNGVGKTTLSTIFKSISYNDPKLIELKKTIGSVEEQEIVIKSTKKTGLLEYKDKKWNQHIENIDVFDIHFIEDFLFVGSITQKKTKENLFSLLLGNKGIKFREYGRRLLKEILSSSKKYKHDKKKRLEFQNSPDYIATKEKLDKLLIEYDAYSQPIFERQIASTNKYLSKFAPYIKLEKFCDNRPPGISTSNYEVFRPFLSLKVHDEIVSFQTPNYTQKKGNVKFTLSEGDKSAFALCFFLGLLECNEISDRVIIIDDPLSSFDYGRRTTTINHIAKIATSCKQFFLLTHDIHFAKEVTDKLSFTKCQNLKIENNGVTSYFKKHQIDIDILSSLQKDILILKKYLKEGASDDFEQREAIRCIRPILEGTVKTKYFEYFSENDWLGDIISKIRGADRYSHLYPLKEILLDLIELNDFSKKYHHSASIGDNQLIDSIELRKYVDLLLNTIYKI